MRMQVRIGTVGTVGAALRFAESVLLAPGQRHARRNAWAAVCENRRHAADRVHAAALSASADPGTAGRNRR
ncbi:hypothetical protein [Kitasatospora sp. NPDC101183]|uniref:hypothetical protein n=1 Tax=Kitasatospora sp. NPDC101183 TaxID=3364100 RepID=UPI003814725B